MTNRRAAAAQQCSHDRAVEPVFTRRQAMASAGHIVVAVGVTALPVACMKQLEQPWSDGTFWDDGTGWVG